MRRTLIAFSLLTLAATAASAQEAVLLRITGQPGQFNHYVATADLFARGGQMAAMMSPDTSLPTTHTQMWSTRTLTSVTGDTLTITEVIDSARFDSPAMPQMAAMMGPRMLEALRGRTTVTKMDARAHVFSTTVTSPQEAAPGGRGGMMGGGGGNQRPLFSFPVRPVHVGETWTDTMITPGENGVGAANFVATFRLERIDDHPNAKVAVVSINGTTTSQTPSGPVTMNVTGEVQIDVSNNRLAQMNMTTKGTVTTQQGDQIPMRMVATQQLVP